MNNTNNASIKILTTAVLATTVAFTSLSAMAAKPTSIKYVEDIVTESEVIYSHYRVKCSNGEMRDISAWDNRKQWCLDKGKKDVCNKKQIKTAKKACK